MRDTTRVVLAVPSLRLEEGGLAEFACSLGKHLSGTAAEVILLTSGSHAFEGRCGAVSLSPESIRIAMLGKERPVASMFSLGSRALSGVLDAAKPFLIHDNGIWHPFHLSVSSFARRRSIPLVISTHGMLEPWALRHKSAKKRVAWLLYQRRILERANVLHATSTQEAMNIRSLGLRAPMAVVPPGVEIPARPRRLRPMRSMRTLLFLSRIHPKKGLLNLVEAWKQAQPPGWRVVVAGPDDGEHRREVERAILRLKLEKTFELMGPAYGTEKEELFRDADLFVLPTLSENFGIVVPEALGRGVPVITTKGAPWEILAETRCGWWVELGLEPLATAIREATALTDEERLRMGERGRALVERDYAWDTVADKMLTTYRWLLGHADRPAWVHVD